MAIALLDVNVLVALAWPNHTHHGTARDWFNANKRNGWATTPITELGFVRVSSNKRVIPTATTPRAATEVLHRLCAQPGHEFWPDQTRLVEPPFPLDHLGAYRQVTDVHLVALAVAQDAKLVTMDKGAVEAVPPDWRHRVELVR